MLNLSVLPVAPLPPAPGADEHPALDLANSATRLPNIGTVEQLGSPAAATAWLVGRGLAPEHAQLQDYCADLLVGLRGQVRHLFEAAVHGSAPDAAALTAVNRAMTSTPAVPTLVWDVATGFRARTAHPTTRILEHALAVIAADAMEIVTGPNAQMLAACEADPCNRYMLRTHARRHWCSKRCGDRIRAARAYARRGQRSD